MDKSNLLNRAKGCLIGLACGDYLGMPYEFKSVDKIEEQLKVDGLHAKPFLLFPNKEVVGYYTDDTATAICLAESLIEKGFDTKDQFIRYKKWLTEGYATPDDGTAFGVGQHTFDTLMNKTENELPHELDDDPKAGGNGALMRCVPIAIYYHNRIEDIKNKSIKAAIVTHNNEIAAWSCVIQNIFIAYSLNEIEKHQFREKILTDVQGIPHEITELLETDFDTLDAYEIPTIGYSLYTLAIALHAFFTTESFEECVTQCVAVGGDTDTQAAVGGALAGAYYGYDAIPTDWVQNLMKSEYIKVLAERLYYKDLSD